MKSERERSIRISKGVKNPREPKAKDRTGGTEYGKSELTCKIV